MRREQPASLDGPDLGRNHRETGVAQEWQYIFSSLPISLALPRNLHKLLPPSSSFLYTLHLGKEARTHRTSSQSYPLCNFYFTISLPKCGSEQIPETRPPWFECSVCFHCRPLVRLHDITCPICKMGNKLTGSAPVTCPAPPGTSCAAGASHRGSLPAPPSSCSAQLRAQPLPTSPSLPSSPSGSTLLLEQILATVALIVCV